MESGWVYCMTNEAMPGMVKIGYTDRKIEDRLAEANGNPTWLPFPFVLECAKFVTDANAKEQILHKLLNVQRVSPRREFFRVNLDQVKLMLSLCDGKWWEPGTTEDPDGAIKRALTMGDEVVSSFLNLHIYPSTGGPMVRWEDVRTAFLEWKKTNGHHYGNVKK